MKEELTATFLEERYRQGSFVIATIGLEDGGAAKCKLSCAEGELAAGLSYRFYGRWHDHRQYGPQFVAETFVQVTPHDRHGVVKYLQRADGIGPAIARKLWNLYQGNAVRRLREDPDAVAAAVGGRFSREKAELAAAYFESEKATEDATIELVGLFSGRGFPRSLARDAIKRWGNAAHVRVRRNPYALMAFPGVGFARTDELYLQLGKNPAALKRQLLAIWHALTTDSGGHTWFDTDFIERALADRLGGAAADPVRAVKLGLRAGVLALHKTHRPWITARVRSDDELAIAERVALLEEGTLAWPGVTLSTLSDHQTDQLHRAIARPVGVFAGGPGTGKTYSAARLIARLLELGGADQVAILAPTGKAAVRLTEAMGASGLDVRARTIHSFLRPTGYEGGRFTFDHGEGNPVEPRYVIVDESSMVDVPTMAALLRAMRADGHLLLIGDVNQLPPVGHGAPLRDLIAAGVAYGELTEIRRNSGAIVETCARIRESKRLELSDGPLRPETGENLVIFETPQDQAAGRIVQLVRGIRGRELADPVWDVQVICAVNEKGALSRKALNAALRQELNHANRQPRGFWRHDKVVCLRNQFLPAVRDAMDVEELDGDDLEGLSGTNDRGDLTLYIANGELGRVIEDLPQKCILEFFAPRRVVLYPKKEGAEVEGFDLGYAISCHKSQGAEWPIVIVGLDDSGAARRICDRAWIYTAMSRAKTACLLVGESRTVATMVRQQKVHLRRTFLESRVKKERRRFAIDRRSAVDASVREPVPRVGGRTGEAAVPLRGTAD